jgi:hypothetical protein
MLTEAQNDEIERYKPDTPFQTPRSIYPIFYASNIIISLLRLFKNKVPLSTSTLLSSISKVNVNE